jgi:hypothetical protein
MHCTRPYVCGNFSCEKTPSEMCVTLPRENKSPDQPSRCTLTQRPCTCRHVPPHPHPRSHPFPVDPHPHPHQHPQPHPYPLTCRPTVEAWKTADRAAASCRDSATRGPEAACLKVSKRICACIDRHQDISKGKDSNGVKIINDYFDRPCVVQSGLCTYAVKLDFGP